MSKRQKNRQFWIKKYIIFEKKVNTFNCIKASSRFELIWNLRVINLILDPLNYDDILTNRSMQVISQNV